MKKAFKIILISGLALVLLAVVLAYVFLNSAVKSAITTCGPRLTGTALTVDSASLSPFSGSGAVNGIVVGNPQGFSSSHAVRAESVRVRLAASTLFSDPLVIREITIEAPDLIYEAGLGGSNIDRILKNIDEAIGQERSARKVIIEDLTIKNGVISLSTSILGGKTVRVPLQDIHLTDIGKKNGGVTALEAVGQVMRPLARNLTAASAVLLKDAGPDMLKKGIDSFKELLGK